MIAVVDYLKGNLQSVEKGLLAAGAREVHVTSDACEIARADAVVLPGVGAFADAAATMRELGQMEAVRERIEAGVPFLGICLGMHLLFEAGEEGAPGEGERELSPDECPRGLGILPGLVTRMPRTDATGAPYKIPHVGWNSVDVPACQPSVPQGAEAGASDGSLRVPQGAFSCPLLVGTPVGEYFYFTHSYLAPAGPWTVGETVHSVSFPSVVQAGARCFGVQFHPEKSSDAGAAVLAAFVRIAKEA